MTSLDLGTNQESSKLREDGTNLSKTEHATLYDWYGYGPAALDEVEIFIAHKRDKRELGEVRPGRRRGALCRHPVCENGLVQHGLVKEVAQQVQASARD